MGTVENIKNTLNNILQKQTPRECEGWSHIVYLPDGTTFSTYYLNDSYYSVTFSPKGENSVELTYAFGEWEFKKDLELTMTNQMVLRYLKKIEASIDANKTTPYFTDK